MARVIRPENTSGPVAYRLGPGRRQGATGGKAKGAGTQTSGRRRTSVEVRALAGKLTSFNFFPGA